jgi:hypothetical protein
MLERLIFEGKLKSRSLPILLVIAFIMACLNASSQTVPVDSARNYIGKTVTVYGRIVDGRYLANYANKLTILHMGGRYPRQKLTIVIRPLNRANFQYQPELELLNETIYVTGKLSLYDGKPQMIIEGPADISFTDPQNDKTAEDIENADAQNDKNKAKQDSLSKAQPERQVSNLPRIQKMHGSVQAIVKDSIGMVAVSNATVTLVSATDSSTVASATTATNGSFHLRNIDTGTYSLVISHQGLETIKRLVKISVEKLNVDIGLLKMQKEFKVLEEVVVKSEPAVKVNGDTISYRADAFATKPNATVEDLLKKLPGVQVERDGTVKSQGEQVHKVYVDGKEFFSNDPQLATKNLTADMVEKVQIYNDKSEQSKFNGIDDGTRNKAINLSLKKNRRKGAFGDIYAGYGTSNRYDAGLSTNFFKSNSQLSVIAKSNNINNISYNSAGTGGGLGSGLSTSSSVGLNYRNTGGKKLEVNGSYYLTQTNNSNAVRSARQTFLTDSTLLTDKETVSNNNNKSHRFNLNMVWNIDSLNSIIFNPSLSVSEQAHLNTDSLSSYINKGSTRYIANDSRTLNRSQGTSTNAGNSLMWRKRFKKRGRTFSLNLYNSAIDNKQDRFTSIDTRFYNTDSTPNSKRATDNKISLNNQFNNYNAVASYTEPFGKQTFLEFNYNYSNNSNNADRLTYNYNSSTKAYDQLNDSLSNRFENINKTNRVGTNFRHVFNKNSFQLGFAAQQVLMDNYDFSSATQQSQEYLNLFPAASLNLGFGQSKSLQLNYRGQTNQPGINQLQDVVDITNYPYIRKGNPFLKQEFSNNINVVYNGSNLTRYSSMFFNVSYRSVQNKITNSIEQQPGGIQVTMPVNIEGAYNLNSTLSFSLPVNKRTGSSFNAYTTAYYSQEVGLINNQKNYTRHSSIGETLRLSFYGSDVFDLGINASVTYNRVNYTLQKALNNEYYLHNYSADFAWTFFKRLTLRSDADYVGYTGTGDNIGQNFVIWNASLGLQLFKNKRGELRYSVNNILDRNTSAFRNVGDNFIEDIQQINLNKFSMLRFILKLNRTGSR